MNRHVDLSVVGSRASCIKSLLPPPTFSMSFDHSLYPFCLRDMPGCCSVVFAFQQRAFYSHRALAA